MSKSAIQELRRAKIETGDIKKRIEALVREHFSGNNEACAPISARIPLAVPTFGWEEVWEGIDSLLSANVTMGNKVREFESLFAQYMGARHAIMVNSGSSANLLALSILANPATENHIQLGDEIITPAVTWATTVLPIINCGAVPVLVDVDLETFNLDVDKIEEAITGRTRAIMVVHLLGNPCDMKRVMDIARAHNLFVIEDACEAHGAEFNGRKVGTLGDLATFSFFFSHHITTIEGGMIVTNNDEYADQAGSIRSFGWAREMRDSDGIAARHSDIDPRFLFVNPGYNFKPTEIQGAFGIHQIRKLDGFIEIRQDNARFWTENLREYSDSLWVHEQRPGTRHVWFGYPLTVSPDAPFSRKQLVDFLEERGVETRPIMAGNFADQPVMRLLPYRKVGDLPHSSLVMRNAFLFGNHSGIGEEEREAVLNHIREFMRSTGGTKRR